MTDSALPFIPGITPSEPYDGLINNLLLTMYQGQYARATIASYGWHLHQFCAWLEREEIARPEEVTEAHLMV